MVNAFIRIATNARSHQRPLSLKEATERVQSWFDETCVRIVQPTDALARLENLVDGCPRRRSKTRFALGYFLSGFSPSRLWWIWFCPGLPKGSHEKRA